MSSRELRSNRTSYSHWVDKLNTPDSLETHHDILREEMLEKDRRKRLTILLSSGFILVTIFIIIALFSFGKNPLEDGWLIDNIDLLSNNEEINFYNKMEFYRWLDLAVAEKNQ